jgi:hypothetical protein
LAQRIAQKSPSLGGRWIGHLYDGRYTTTFDARTTRERAMEDVNRMYSLIFEPEVAEEWTPPV